MGVLGSGATGAVVSKESMTPNRMIDETALDAPKAHIGGPSDQDEASSSIQLREESSHTPDIITTTGG